MYLRNAVHTYPFPIQFFCQPHTPQLLFVLGGKKVGGLLVISYSFKGEKHGETERVQPALSVGQSTYCMRKSVGVAPTAGEQTQQKPCRMSSDIGEELENNTVG
jgi:hypothetical protein